jgi:hypothetical protein
VNAGGKVFAMSLGGEWRVRSSCVDGGSTVIPFTSVDANRIRTIHHPFVHSSIHPLLPYQVTVGTAGCQIMVYDLRKFGDPVEKVTFLVLFSLPTVLFLLFLRLCFHHVCF